MLRIEDTDRERSTSENVDQILDALGWLELDWDEGPLSQHERRDRHEARIAELLSDDRAYRDPAGGDEVREWKREHDNAGYRGTPSDSGAVRLRVPDEGGTVVHDLLRGEISFENRLQDDLVIARGDGTPLYNFAVAVDDAEMGITDVVRGDDHLSNTPKQLLVLAALGVEPPRYAHLPLLHGPDGKKLSKRHGAASVQELREAGLPAAGGPQLPGAARLGNRRRHDADGHPRAGRAIPHRSRGPVVGRLRRAEAAVDERALHARAGHGCVRERARRPPRRVRPGRRRRLRRGVRGSSPRRGRDRPRQGADDGGGLEADRIPVRATRRPTRRRGRR